MRDLKLVNARPGEPWPFEILLDDPTFERITLPFVKNLERLGVERARAHGRRRAVREPDQASSTST